MLVVGRDNGRPTERRGCPIWVPQNQERTPHVGTDSDPGLIERPGRDVHFDMPTILTRPSRALTKTRPISRPCRPTTTT